MIRTKSISIINQSLKRSSIPFTFSRTLATVNSTSTSSSSNPTPPPPPFLKRPTLKVSAEEALKHIPGPKTLPFVGAVDYFGKSGAETNFHNFLNKVYQDFGFLTKLQIFGNNQVLVFHPDDIRAVFASDGKYPSSPIDQVPILKLYNDLRDLNKYSVGSLEYEEWRKLRIPLQQHILPPSAAADYLDLINPVSRDFSKLIPNFQDNLKDFIMRYTFEVIGSILFGERFGTVSLNPPKENMEYIRCVRDSFSKSSDFNNILPLWKYFETPGRKEYFKDFDYIMERGIELFLQFKEKAQKDPESVSNTYIAKLLQQTDLDMKSIESVAAGFLMAGVDTTGNVLSWMIIHLGENLEVQEKLYKELNENLKGGDYSEDCKLPYLKKCFKESFRLDPATIAVVRVLQKDVTLRGHLIPAGAPLMMTTIPLYRDPNIFEKADQFIPERWDDSAKQARITSGNLLADNPTMVIPFSFGPRMCLGSRIAQAELNSAIVRLVQDYVIEVDRSKPYTKTTKLFLEPSPYPKVTFTPRMKI